MMMPFLISRYACCSGCKGQRAQQPSVTSVGTSTAIVLDSLMPLLHAWPGSITRSMHWPPRRLGRRETDFAGPGARQRGSERILILSNNARANAILQAAAGTNVRPSRDQFQHTCHMRIEL